MTFEEWNDTIFNRFFGPSHAGNRVYLCVTSDVLEDIGKDCGGERDFIEAVNHGPNPRPKNTRGVFSAAKSMAEEWYQKDMPGKPPFLPYLASLALAASAEITDGHKGFHWRLRKLLNKETKFTNAPIGSFYEMRELWGMLQLWSERENIGNFICSIQAKGSGGPHHVEIPTSQTLLRPHERAKLPLIFLAAELELGDLVSDAELVRLVVKHGQNLLHPRTIKALSGELDDELGVLLIETIFEELNDWQPYGKECALTRQSGIASRLYLNLSIEGVSKTARFWLRYRQEEDENEEELSLFNKQGKEFTTAPSGMEWSQPIYDSEGNFPDWNWLKGENFSDKDGVSYRLHPATVRIFEDGRQYQLPNFIERRRLNASQSFLLAVYETESALLKWVETTCNELSVTGIPPGWRLFSGQKVIVPAEIAKKHPQLSQPVAIRLRLAGGFKIGYSREYLQSMLPKICVEAPAGAYSVMLNGEELVRIDGSAVIEIPKDSKLQDGMNEVVISPLESAGDGGRAARFSIVKEEDIMPPDIEPIFEAVLHGMPETAVSGIVLSNVPDNLPPYPTSVNFTGKSCILIGRTIGQLADSSEWKTLNWEPMWLLAKGRKNLRLQFCGHAISEASPAHPQNGSSGAKRIWEKGFHAKRRDISPLTDTRLAKLWKQYLEASKS